MAMYDSTHTGTEIDNVVSSILNRSRLTDFSLSDLKSAVAANSLEKYGLKVGDQKTINGRTYVIAGMNPFYGTNSPKRLTINHVGLIVVPHMNHAWNSSGQTFNGVGGGAGYANSELHSYLVNTVLPLVQSDLGSQNLLSHSKCYTNAVNQNGVNRYGTATGCSSNFAWVTNQYISALSEIQIYGSIVFSSSGYDTGEANRQLDVFRIYNFTEIFGNYYFWLRDIASNTYACMIDSEGDADWAGAKGNYPIAGLVLFR